MNEELVCLNTTKASHRLVLLHGWGADANDLMPFGEMLTNGLEKKVEIISLQAPHLHPQGVGRQWYGLYPPDWSAVPFEVKNLRSRLKALAPNSIPLEKTVILGFSQGGAMALAVGCNLPVAGLIGCSAYPHPDWDIPSQIPPIFLTHGKNDEVVPLVAMEKIINILETNHSKVDFEVFDGTHEIPLNIIPKISEHLENWFI